MARETYLVIIGYCRICQSEIIRGRGATCSHKGYLIYTPYATFWQGDNSYEWKSSLGSLPEYLGELPEPKSVDVVIQDILGLKKS